MIPGTQVDTQWMILLQGIAVGAALGIIWELLRPIRLFFSHAVKTVFLLDFVFILITAFIFFFFSFYLTQGRIRLYILLSFSVGFIICRIFSQRFLLPFEWKITEKFREKIKKYQNKIKKTK